MKEFNELNILEDFGYQNEYVRGILRSLLGVLDKDLENNYCLKWTKSLGLSNQSSSQRIYALQSIFDTKIDENTEHKAMFVIHTAVSLIVKLLAYSVLSHLNNKPIEKTPDVLSLKQFLNDIESGTIYKEFGIANMCQDDIFSWYLEAEFNDELYRLLAILKDKATQYIASGSIEKDMIKPLYESMVPKSIRHFLGEYYTPQNIADYILNKSKEFLKSDYKAIDPTCGSGAFLLSVIKDKIYSNRIDRILDEVVGADINPTVIITAKFNYILAVYPSMLKSGIKPNDITVPIYLQDIILVSNDIGKFDLVIGNPPWVRWSDLPVEYKTKIKNNLKNECIFSQDTNYGGVDLNVSALISYKSIENLLNKGGILSFIFPYGVLKNKSYEGFRILKFGDKTMEIKQVLIPSKPFFDGEEPVILILKNTMSY
jgi:type I restriction-modification system DNA methylase subunit